MHQDLIRRVVEELRADLSGRFLGKIYQLTPLSFVFDFGVRSGFLYVSVEPSSPRLYLIQRRGRDLQKASTQLNYFGQLLRARTNGCALTDVAKDFSDRIVRLTFRCEDESGTIHFRRLIVQLTGRTANLFLVDELNRIIAVLRGQSSDQMYSPPPAPEHRVEESVLISGSPSEYADAYFTEIDTAKEFDSRATAARSRLRNQLQRQQKLKQHLQRDLDNHGDPAEHKKTGDLLLANVATAVRDGNKILLTDYYADDAPQIELEI
ncbi:MAG TPA: NFACT family protein, partial [Pyrinomonadaceae bacterium]|nr:NFACT family protein [Pyrinomonadaceae bacterium]